MTEEELRKHLLELMKQSALVKIKRSLYLGAIFALCVALWMQGTTTHEVKTSDYGVNHEQWLDDVTGPDANTGVNSDPTSKVR